MVTGEDLPPFARLESAFIYIKFHYCGQKTVEYFLENLDVKWIFGTGSDTLLGCVISKIGNSGKN